jgi:acyl dehydratase
MRVGATITARIEVMSVREDKPIRALETRVVNADREDWLTGTAATCTMPLRR